MSQIVEVQEARRGKVSELFRAGWIPYIGTAISMSVCYFKLITAVILPVLGADWDLNPHVQAVLMWAFALLAVVAVFQDVNEHGNRIPLYIAGTGVAVLIMTLYIYYNVQLEYLAYILLIVGVLLNQNSILKQLNSQIRLQYKRIQQQAGDLTEWNRTLEDRVVEQVAELDRIGQLKRFLSPKVADLIVAEGDKTRLESHRSYVAAMFCDLRGFSSFSERAEPEEVMDILQQYHQTLGRIVHDFGGTIDHRAGDGLMVFFNDPLPCDDPVLQAVKLAFRTHDEIGKLLQSWSKLGHQLGFGIGIAAGYATMGIVGDESRSDYTAIGNGINLASRLCDQAKDGETLISQRAYLEIEDQVEGSEITGLELKGVSRSQVAYSIRNPA